MKMPAHRPEPAPVHRPLRRPLAVAVAALALSAAASAQVTFELKYRNATSEPPPWDDSPFTDDAGKSHDHGRALYETLRHAADHWEALLVDAPATEITVRFKWDNTNTGGIGLTPAGGVCTEQLLSVKRPLGSSFPNTYTIRFNAFDCGDVVPWYVDGLPDGDSRYDMRPMCISSAAGASSAAYVNGSPHALLEVGCEGAARAGHDASIGAANPEEGFDLYTAALHGLGHTLGLGFRSEGDANADGDYDIDPGIEAGGIGLQVASDGSGGHDTGHLAFPHALMSNGMGEGMRRLPSVVDLQAVFHINGWTDVLFPRKYLEPASSEVDFHKITEWAHHERPGPGHGAVLDDGVGVEDVFAEEAIEVKSLFLHGLARLLSGAETVDAGDRLALKDSAVLESAGGLVRAEEILNHGELVLITDAGDLEAGYAFEAVDSLTSLQGLLDADAGFSALHVDLVRSDFQAWFTSAWIGFLIIDADSKFEGGSTVVDSVSTLVNDGVIAAQNGDLTFKTAIVASGADHVILFDLDGDVLERGVLDARGGSLFFEAGALDPFNGSAYIAYAEELSIAGDFPVGDLGRIELQGDGATLRVEYLDLRAGEIVANGGSGSSVFVIGRQTIRHDGRLLVDAGNRLFLVGGTALQGGLAADGAGRLVQRGPLHVFTHSSETRIQTASYSWDGEAPGGSAGPFADTVVHRNGVLVIESALVSPDGAHDGTITLQPGAVLEVDDDWILEGTLDLNGATIRAGGTLVNRGVIVGAGTIETNVVNEGVITGLPPGLAFTGGFTSTPAGSESGAVSY